MHRLKSELQKSLNDLNFANLTEVQRTALEPALAGRDLIVQSYTGTGKTGAFLLPILNKLSDKLVVQALVLTPTRELAVQVATDCRKFSKHLGTRIAIVYGGAGIENQVRALRSGAQLVVGTPGRVLDLIGRGELRLSNIRALVLDEADVMLDMGFQRDVERIISFTPKTRQTMFFCVDLPSEIKRLAAKHLNSPQRINLLKGEKTVGSVKQTVYLVNYRKKLEFLIHLLREIKPTRSIIFCRTKRSTARLAIQLQRAGFNAEEIHGNLSQSRRSAIMDAFKAGELDLLIATDVAARGIHVHKVSHVFNYELPADVKYYLHRIGRTGRVDEVGDAVSLVSFDEEKVLREIEMLIGKKIERKEAPAKFSSSPPSHVVNKAHGFHAYSKETKRLF